MHHVRAAYCGGERYKILLPRGTAQPTSSQAEAHTDLMPTQQAYSEVKFLLTSLNFILFDAPAQPAGIFGYETSFHFSQFYII